MTDEVTVERTEAGNWAADIDGRQVAFVLDERDDWWIEKEARGARNLEQHAQESALGYEAVLAARRSEREAARARRAATSE